MNIGLRWYNSDVEKININLRCETTLELILSLRDRVDRD